MPSMFLAWALMSAQVGGPPFWPSSMWPVATVLKPVELVGSTTRTYSRRNT